MTTPSTPGRYGQTVRSAAPVARATVVITLADVLSPHERDFRKEARDAPAWLEQRDRRALSPGLALNVGARMSSAARLFIPPHGNTYRCSQFHAILPRWKSQTLFYGVFA